MISKYSHKGLNWIDLESPTEEEISHIVEQHPIPLYIQEEIRAKKTEDKVNINNGFTYISLHKSKVQFIVHDNFILSIHENPIHAFDKFGKELELDIIVEDKSEILTNQLLFTHLLKNLYEEQEIKLEKSEAKMKILEKFLMDKNKKLKFFIILSIILLVSTIIFICL